MRLARVLFIVVGGSVLCGCATSGATAQPPKPLSAAEQRRVKEAYDREQVVNAVILAAQAANLNL